MKLNLSSFIRILLPFGLTQLGGIYLARKLLPLLGTLEPRNLNSFSYTQFIIAAIVLVAFVFIGIKFRRVGGVFYKIFLSILIFTGAQTVFAIWISYLVATLLAVLLLILFWAINNVLVQDIAMILTFVGVGAAVGVSLAPSTAAVILVVLSFYDIIAVYQTGYMIRLAKRMIESRAIFGFVIPNRFGGLKERIAQVAPGDDFMILGSGDAVVPLLLSGALARTSAVQGLIVACFSIAGLLLMHLIFTNQAVRRPMAALPPIAMLTIIGYLMVSIFGIGI